MSMCHLTGSIFKTDKSALFKALEKSVQSKAATHKYFINRRVPSKICQERSEMFLKKNLQVVANDRVSEVHLIS